jgi:(p)ppGpp synthase/HD superfamily hydrolase
MNCIDLDNLTQEDIARFIAYRAHAGQFRRDGVTPYITHPEAVANSFPQHAVYERAVAWLHDVLEDNEQFCTYALRVMGVDLTVVDAVVILTKKRDQLYDDYIDRVLTNPLAMRVKIADIRHNLSCNPKETTKVRYASSLKKLEAATGKTVSEAL